MLGARYIPTEIKRGLGRKRSEISLAERRAKKALAQRRKREAEGWTFRKPYQTRDHRIKAPSPDRGFRRGENVWVFVHADLIPDWLWSWRTVKGGRRAYLYDASREIAALLSD